MCYLAVVSFINVTIINNVMELIFLCPTFIISGTYNRLIFNLCFSKKKALIMVTSKVMKYLMITISCAFLSCSPNNESNEVRQDKSTVIVTETPPKDFALILSGVWVLKNYVSDIKKTKSPLKSSYLLDGVCTMVIDAGNFSDSTIVAVSWNNHEGMNFTLYNQRGQSPSQLKTNLVDYDNQHNYFELGYNITGADTTLSIYHYDKTNKLLSSTSYIRVLESQDETSCDWGITVMVNKTLLGGPRLVIDSNNLAQNVTFINDGRIEGHPAFDSFKIFTDFNGGPIASFDGVCFMKNGAYSCYAFQVQGDTTFLYSTRGDVEQGEKEELAELVYRIEPGFSVTDSMVYDLMHRVLVWADTNSVLDIVPVIQKDSIYNSVDMTKQKMNRQVLTETNIFSKQFTNTYDTIINKIDSLLKSGEEESVWLVGDLPPYNFANDASPWCDCQDNLGWSKIIIEHINGSDYVWKWDVASELGPGWDEHRYSFSVTIEDGTLKVSRMEGFNPNFK